MKMEMNRAIAGYILAGIAMLVLLPLPPFPGGAGDGLHQGAVAAVRFPGMLLSIDTVQPAVPPGVAIS